ncbi:hypothetical protein HaLaN_32504, partial [Haematococcus lacustris]
MFREPKHTPPAIVDAAHSTRSTFMSQHDYMRDPCNLHCELALLCTGRDIERRSNLCLDARPPVGCASLKFGACCRMELAVRLGDVGPACLEQQLGCGRMTATQLPRPASWSHSQLGSVHTPAASSVAAASQPSTIQADMPGLVCDQRESASSQPWARSGGLCKRAGFPLSLTAPQQTCWPCPTTQPLTSSAWAVSGTRGIHGWAAATRNTNAIIRQLPSMEAVQ